MSVQVPIDWKAINDAIFDWFSGSTGLVTIWEDQDLPQPEYPYASLDIISGPTRVGGKDDIINTTDLTKTGEEVELCHLGHRHFTVACQIHVGPKKDATGTFQEPDPNEGARSLMSSAEGQLETIATKRLFRPIGLAFVNRLAMLSLDLPIAGQIVSRVQMDVQFATTSRVVERETFIESVELTGTFKDQADDTVSVEDFSVDSTP